MEESIIDSNKLIAEFMNYDDIDCDKCKYNFDCNHLQCCLNSKEKDLLLSYHSDWNWLMPVIEKIESLGYEVLIGRISCNVNEMLNRENPIISMVCGDITQKIGLIFSVVVKFINWYNAK